MRWNEMKEQQRRPGVDRWRGRTERSGPRWINYHYPSARNEIVRTPPNVIFAVTGYRARIATHFRSPRYNDRPGKRRRMSKMMDDNVSNFNGSNLYRHAFDFENSQVCQIRDVPTV